jgi:folate-binding protein YgfZ
MLRGAQSPSLAAPPSAAGRAARPRLAAAPAPVAAAAATPTLRRQRTTTTTTPRPIAAARSNPLDLSALEIPDIEEDVVSHQARLGASFDDSGLVAVTFDNTADVLAALRGGALLADRSHACSRVRVAGAGALDFLHGQTTADVKRLLSHPGTGCEACIVTPQARCLDLVTILRTGEESFLLLGSGGEAGAALVARLQKFVFKGDQVAVTDVSAPTRVFSLLGPRAAQVLRELAGEAAASVAVEERGPGGEEEQVRPGAPPKPKTYAPAELGAHVTLSFRGAPVLVACGSGLASAGYTLLADESVAADLYAALALPRAPADGDAASKQQPALCTPIGEADWQRARVTQGRPAAGAELTLDSNPLEAGLFHAVSVNKGCYVGQEALAKISVPGGAGPRRQLWGVQLSEAASPGDVLYAADERAAKAAGLLLHEEEEGEDEGAAAGSGGAQKQQKQQQQNQPQRPIGMLTSAVDLLDNGHFGLALLRCRTSAGGRSAATLPLEGLALRVRSAESGPLARVVDVPYASRVFPEGSGPVVAAGAGGAGAGAGAAAAAAGGLAEREAAALAAKAEAKAEEGRLRAEKLAAAQAKIDAWKRQQQQQQQQQKN